MGDIDFLIQRGLITESEYKLYKSRDCLILFLEDSIRIYDFNILIKRIEMTKEISRELKINEILK